MRGDIRQCGLPGYELGDYIREAMDFLREHEPPEGYFVGFSGGKDSITSLELCRMAGVKHQAYYTQTGIDPPDIMSFVRTHYPQVQWLRPAKSFFARIQTKAPPLRMQRWCCEYIKERPSWSVPLDRRVLGIRAEESKERADLGRINPHKIAGGRVLTTYHPIYTWPEWAVWDFIAARRLSVPSLYDEGFGRIGCIPCPYSCWDHRAQPRPDVHIACQDGPVFGLPSSMPQNDGGSKSVRETILDLIPPTTTGGRILMGSNN